METRPPGLQMGLVCTKGIQEVFASTARMKRDQVRRERATLRRDEPEAWAAQATKPGFMKKLSRILDELEGHGEEGPGPVSGDRHNLVPRERDPEGARYGEPYGADLWSPEGRKEKPRGMEDNKGRPGCGTEHSRSLPWEASDGTRDGEPYGTISRNPEERTTKPGGV
jgi:hypothetical protein